MVKFRELLFLKSIKRVGKSTIYSKYWDLLVNSKDFDDLVSKMSSKISQEKIDDALNKSEILFNQVINDSEINVITVFDDEYPKKLMDMGNKRPLILYVKGNVEALNKPNISVIGTRKPSKLSQEFEKDLVKNIVNISDRVVVSGLALGCDKIAHKTTVDEGKVTIAVLPSGVNVIKPKSNIELAEKIIATGGCLVSEYDPNTKVNRGSYVERDKIVAALSDATFVVECGVKSGTMHTVDAACEYQRQIYSYLPDERTKGSYDGNELIINEKYNSIKVEYIEEFLMDLNTLNVKKHIKTGQQTLDF